MSKTINPRRRRSRRLAQLLAAAALAGGLGAAAGSPAAADDVPIGQREYSVRFHQIKALDETGPVNFGLSDEIYAGFHTTFPGGSTNVQSGLFGDFDAGETRTARADQHCLMPIHQIVNNGSSIFSGLERDTWACGTRGFTAPFSMRAVVFESDTEIPFCGIPCSFEPNSGGAPALNPRGRDDDKVGETNLSFSATGLAADMPTRGASRDYTVEHRGSGGHYRITYRVTRAA